MQTNSMLRQHGRACCAPGRPAPTPGPIRLLRSSQLPSPRRNLSRSLTTNSTEPQAPQQPTSSTPPADPPADPAIQAALRDADRLALIASSTPTTSPASPAVETFSPAMESASSPAPEFQHSLSPSPSPESRSPSPSARQAHDSFGTSHPLPDEDIAEEEDFFATKELIGELQTGFGQRGEAWVFTAFVTVLLVLFYPFKLMGLIDMLGTLSLTAGLVFLIYAAISLGRNLSPLPLPRMKHRLATGGMYAYVRHPMYGGILLATLGLACLTRSETRLALTALLWWILENMVSTEEKALVERYPDQYTKYQGDVKKFIPFLY